MGCQVLGIALLSLVDPGIGPGPNQSGNLHIAPGLQQIGRQLTAVNLGLDLHFPVHGKAEQRLGVVGDDASPLPAQKLLQLFQSRGQAIPGKDGSNLIPAHCQDLIREEESQVLAGKDLGFCRFSHHFHLGFAVIHQFQALEQGVELQVLKQAV